MTGKGYSYVKRFFDIVLSAAGIAVTLPIWLISVIGIEVSDPGPVFYRANRIGIGNKPFLMFKFRSMTVDASADEKSFRADASRIFPFGAVMRSLKIDELPQLLNVFAGSMSIVGPRPAASDQADIVRAGRYARAADVKPGLTGPAALYDYIYGDTVTDEAEYEEKVLPDRLELEIYYVAHFGALYDMKMIWYTAVSIACSLFGKTPDKILNELRNCIGTTETEEAAETVLPNTEREGAAK